MILFHFIYDLKTFASPVPALIQDLPKWFWFWAPATIGSTFLFVSGLSLRMSLSKAENSSLQKNDLLRLAKLISLALLITVFSLIYMPTAPIYFGILHCMSFGTLLVLLLRGVSPSLVFTFGVLIVVGGIVLEFTEPLSFTWLNWLGFRSRPSPLVSDYYPVMPFAGIMLVGYAIPDRLRCILPVSSKRGLPLPFLNILGRNSLVIYLIHQPLLVSAVKLFW